MAKNQTGYRSRFVFRYTQLARNYFTNHGTKGCFQEECAALFEGNFRRPQIKNDGTEKRFKKPPILNKDIFFQEPTQVEEAIKNKRS